ncbi:hypothetical protein M0R45_001645 [Rubus argutus]|uniref:Uncharacterized protein n=1 Tax=Rubus argutus TaxID=59490 RepID=A0AAW1VKG6_RUBAR
MGIDVVRDGPAWALATAAWSVVASLELQSRARVWARHGQSMVLAGDARSRRRRSGLCGAAMGGYYD